MPAAESRGAGVGPGRAALEERRRSAAARRKACCADFYGAGITHKQAAKCKRFVTAKKFFKYPLIFATELITICLALRDKEC